MVLLTNEIVYPCHAPIYFLRTIYESEVSTSELYVKSFTNWGKRTLFLKK